MNRTNFSPLLRIVAWTTIVISLATPFARAADEEVADVIARARQFLGGDAALEAVTSLHYTGTVNSDDGQTHEIDIFASLPLMQRVVETQTTRRVTTVLNDYDCWRRDEHLEPPISSKVALLNASDVRRMRANTWQNIYFYKDINAVGGAITVLGEEEIDGVVCVKTEFVHTGGIRFFRFFDKATGRLVLTRTDEGVESRESGEMYVAGVRFPQQLTTTLKGQSSTVVFETVTVNEPVVASLFETPMPKFSFPLPPAAPETAPAPDAAAATPESAAPVDAGPARTPATVLHSFANAPPHQSPEGKDPAPPPVRQPESAPPHPVPAAPPAPAKPPAAAAP